MISFLSVVSFVDGDISHYSEIAIDAHRSLVIYLYSFHYR